MTTNKTIHFIAGLPRSGSTLLCNILEQNPRFHATTTSGILEVLTGIRNGWDGVDGFRANPCEQAKQNVLRACLHGYFEHCEEPVVFDKSRGWTSYIEMAEAIIGGKAKIICPVRDVRDIVANFEKLTRKYAAFSPLPQERNNPLAWSTLQGRIEAWTNSGGPVGSAFNRIQDAITRGFRDRIHFVEFERLTRNPRQVLNELHDFIGEQHYEYDFDNVAQKYIEDDTGFGFPAGSLHNIRPKVAPKEPEWPGIIPEDMANAMAQSNRLWKPVSEIPQAGQQRQQPRTPQA